jgi:hypothetical protein
LNGVQVRQVGALQPSKEGGIHDGAVAALRIALQAWGVRGLTEQRLCPCTEMGALWPSPGS